MVILDEEASQGGSMPDLTPQVDVVAAAVITLVKVIGELCAAFQYRGNLVRELDRFPKPYCNNNGQLCPMKSSSENHSPASHSIF